MKGSNSIEEENDKIKNPEELLPFDFECLRLSDDKEPEPKISTSSKKITFKILLCLSIVIPLIQIL